MVGSANCLNIVGNGVPVFDGVHTFSAATIQNHGVVIGNPLNGITSITPDASTTKVLVSGGASADPSWQDISAAGGIATITGDSGGAESPSAGNFNLLGGTTGLTFAGSAATETLTGTLVLANGGTSASLTASNGGIFYSTDSAGAILAGTATANKMLLSGSTAAPTWSTSTIPSSAGATANKVLLSDGTNYVLSTPTFPNASATSGKIIISDGTNWIESTPTYPSAAGTSGNVLTSNGTNWTSAAPSAGGISTLNGNSGSATGSTVTIAGSEGSATFTGSGSTMTLSFTKATQNTAIGFGAGNSGGGTYNSAFGYNALSQASSGANYNCAFGRYAGINTTSTAGSSYFGYFAGYDSIGNNCTAVGFTALGSGGGAMLGDFNLAVGSGAGSGYANGNSGNIAIAAVGVSGDVNITRIGYVNTTGTTSSQLGCYIDGINGVVAGSAAVLVATTGQLGVAASSERFKLNIVDMVDTSDVVSKLRPVNFNWNKKSAPGLADASDDVQYGLISEEVDKVFPYLCSYDKDGKPFSVKYDQLPAILLNELQKAIKRIAVLEAKLGV